MNNWLIKEQLRVSPVLVLFVYQKFAITYGYDILYLIYDI